MPGKEHELITRHAVKLLPEWQLDVLGSEAERLCAEFCAYPDVFFDVGGAGHAKARPYYFETDGIQFHYIPDTPVIDKYRYWTVRDGKLRRMKSQDNQNWIHARNGFKHYLSQAVARIRQGELGEAVAYLGCLLHMLQDACYSLHSLEGPYGTDLFVLDRLFDWQDDVDRLPSNILAEGTPDEAVTTPRHTPRSLGASVDEVVFILYSRYVHTCLEARKITFAIVQARYAHEDCARLYERMFHNIVALCADVLCSALGIALGKVEGLPQAVSLVDIEPVDRPWGLGFYRFVTLLKDRALLPDRTIGPLRLIGGDGPETFLRGLSFGSHVEFRFAYELPRGVFSHFRCRIGIQAEFVEEGEAAVRFIQDGVEVYNSVFNKASPAGEVDIERPGGRLELLVSSPEAVRSKTVITIAEPTLLRAALDVGP